MYTVIKPALKMHDLCSKFASLCASGMLPRVNGV